MNKGNGAEQHEQQGQWSVDADHPFGCLGTPAV